MSTILLKKKKEASTSKLGSSFVVLYDPSNTRRILYKGKTCCEGPSGYGTYHYPNGASYEGHWEGGLREGYGILRSGTQIYDGDWKKGRRHGFGRQEYEITGRVYYEGSWIKGRKHGWGRMVFRDGRIYEGSWVKGDFHGEGYLLYPDGQRFVGEWKRGVLNGEGHYWVPGTRDVLQGTWKGGLFRRGSVLISPT